jgi:hypothetical protein
VASEELAIAEPQPKVLQLHHIAAFRRADQTRTDIGVFLRQTADVARIVVVLNHLIAISHCVLLL